MEKSLASPLDCKEIQPVHPKGDQPWDFFHFSLSCIGEGNGNPLQCSCLENPRDGGAWWAAVYVPVPECSGGRAVVVKRADLGRHWSIVLVMPSNHLMLSHPLLLLPSIFPSIRVFSNEPVLYIR